MDLIKNSSNLEIESKIRMMFDILRKNKISSEDYHVVLFLLSIYKDGIKLVHPVKTNLESGKWSISENQKSNDEKFNFYSNILESYEPILNTIDFYFLNQLFEILSEINKEILGDNFHLIFDNILFEVLRAQGKHSVEIIQPTELTRFMYSLVNPPIEAKVFNPFAGIASFGVYPNPGFEYYGQELNKKIWVLGALRLMAYKKPIISSYFLEDSILQWPSYSRKFDLIIACPPNRLDLKAYRLEGKFINSYRSAEQFIIEKSLENLTPAGKLVTLVSDSFLQKINGSEHIIANLIDEDLIDLIISLPTGVIPFTSMKVNILVLSRQKERKGQICLINGDSFVDIKKSGSEVILNDIALTKFIQNHKEDENIIRIISKEKIQENDYKLHIARYFQQQIEGVKLGDILEPIKGQKGYLPQTGKLIRIRDLKDDSVDFKLNLSNIEETDLKRSDIHLVSESCLLLAMRWKTLKPTLFEFKGEPIYKSQDILCFKVNESLVDKEFIIAELTSSYVKEQVESYRIGSTIPFIREKDLMKVIIKLPSIEEQRAKVEGIKQTFIKTKENELVLQKKILGIKEDQFREFASIKHTFRQYLGALKSNVTGTRKFLTKKDGQVISLNDIYSKNLNQSLGDHLRSLEDTIASMATLLETESFTSDDKNTESFNLLDLVKRAQNCFKQNIFDFEETFFDENSFVAVRENEDGSIVRETISPYIDINQDDFFKLFSNIVSNAIDHGFKNKKENIIRTVIFYDPKNENCTLEVSNNGYPMDERFTYAHLITRGEKTTDSKGTGIGGADIKAIVEQYNGSFELIIEKNSIFPVTYKISFPISKTIIENEISSTLD